MENLFFSAESKYENLCEFQIKKIDFMLLEGTKAHFLRNYQIFC